MFERFTERARQVVVLAQDEARSFGHKKIAPEHILAGLLREEEGTAALVLTPYLSVDDVRNDIRRYVGEGDDSSPLQLPFKPETKRILEGSLREALSMGHNYIGTEHLLLGLTREETLASLILRDTGLNADTIRDLVVSHLTRKALPEKEASEETSVHVIAFQNFLERAKAFEAGTLPLEEYLGG